MLQTIVKHFVAVPSALTSEMRLGVTDMAQTLAAVRSRGSRVCVCGNGGSAANAAHLVLHLRDVGLKAIDLGADLAWLTASANDVGYEQVFRRGLLSHGSGPEDLLIVISGSGNSPNILEALEYAVVHDIPRWGLLGMGGGKAVCVCDGAVVVDSGDYGIIEDIHSVCIHALHKALA